jgi:uncharacterized damage-inducible protein DinB
MRTEIEQLLSRYESGPNMLAEVVRGLSAEQLRARPIAGQWSAMEVVCHLADTDQFLADRMKRTIALNRPLLIGADPDDYPRALRYHHHDLDEELTLIRITRAQMARTLRLQPDDAWARTAVHSEVGLIDLRAIVTKAADHLDHHVETIRKKRTAMDIT